MNYGDYRMGLRIRGKRAGSFWAGAMLMLGLVAAPDLLHAADAAVGDQAPMQAPVQVSERRPGAVTADAVLTFVLSGLTILVLLIGIVGVIGAHVDPGPDPDDALSGSDAVASLIVIGVALVATVTAIVLAGLALGRWQGPRVTLVVLAILDALVLAVIAAAMIVDGRQPATSAGEVVGGVVVLVFAVPPALCAILLLLPSSGRWYAGRPRG